MLSLFAFRRMTEPTPFLPSFFLPEISSFWRTPIAITPTGTQKVLPTLLGRKYSIGSSPLTSSPGISFAPSSLALSCSWEVLQDLGSNHLPILLSVSLSPFFHPNKRPSSFNFQKARWDDFAYYFDFHCSSAEEYSPLSFSFSVTLLISLALNTAKSSIPFGRIKRLPKDWGSDEVLRKDPFLALCFSLSSLMIFLLFCLLPSAALFTLTIWPFGPPLPRSPLRWRPHKELCFDCSAGLSTGVFLSIRANVRPPFQWIPTKLTYSPTFSYSAPASVLIPLRLFLGSPSTALFPFLNMYLRWRPNSSHVSRPYAVSLLHHGPL